MFTLTKSTLPKLETLSTRNDLLAVGNLKMTTATALSMGTIKTLILPTIEKLFQVLDSLNDADVQMTRVAIAKTAPQIITPKMLAKRAIKGMISQTAKHLKYLENGGFMFLDYNDLVDSTYTKAKEFIEFLYRLSPALPETKTDISHASLLHICQTDTEEGLTGAQGFHEFIPIMVGDNTLQTGAVLKDPSDLLATEQHQLSQS